MSISALTRKKTFTQQTPSLSSSSIQIYTKVYKQRSKWHVFYATLKWTNINQKPDITLSVRLCTNIKQIKTYTTMAVTWVRFNYWIQQKISIQCAIQKPFFVSHTNKASRTGINRYKTSFHCNKTHSSGLMWKGYGFYIHIMQKKGKTAASK